MDEKYVSSLELAIESLTHKSATLETDLEDVKNQNKQNEEYIKTLLSYFIHEFEEEKSKQDLWQTLQTVSKLDKKRYIEKPNTETGNTLYKYLCQRLHLT